LKTKAGQSHWVGPEPDPSKYFGFIYVIRDETSGKQYVGKKQYWTAITMYGCKTRQYNRQSPKWNPKCWKESGWRTYKGSSKIFTKYMRDNKDHVYTYEILMQCTSRGSLHYAELRELWRRDVLTKRGPDGDYMYFNVAIQAIKFRPPEDKGITDVCL
jgi:hypothetical protein